jgi:hypothetical protein
MLQFDYYDKNPLQYANNHVNDNKILVPDRYINNG